MYHPPSASPSPLRPPKYPTSNSTTSTIHSNNASAPLFIPKSNTNNSANNNPTKSFARAVTVTNNHQNKQPLAPASRPSFSPSPSWTDGGSDGGDDTSSGQWLSGNSATSWENYEHSPNTRTALSPALSASAITSSGASDSAVKRERGDPSVDLDYGLDMRKFGLDEHHDDDDSSQQSTHSGSMINADHANGQQSAAELRVQMLSLLYDPPVQSCELKPYVSVIDTSTNRVSAINNDTPMLHFTWSRGDKRLCFCNEPATMQCLTCVKLSVPPALHHFCSIACMINQWQQHRAIHKEGFDRMRLLKSAQRFLFPLWHCDDEDDTAYPQDETAIHCRFPPPPTTNYHIISNERCYTPSADDVGCALKLSVVPVRPHHAHNDHTNADVHNTTVFGSLHSLDTSQVISPPPLPPTRSTIYATNANGQQYSTNSNSFKVIDYNILAQCYASRNLYPYCPLWALHWEYRRSRILHEILSYNADIICLQEIQRNHYENYFSIELKEYGYDGVFKHKTRESLSDDPMQIDGCATFYRRDRFTLTEQYGIEYNEAARQWPQAQYDRKALRRLLKGNIALVIVLEEIQAPPLAANQRRPLVQRRRKLCIANTHMFWDPEYADVKLWQTYVLLSELEKLLFRTAAGYNLMPMVLCGDFNSLTDSAVYELLSTGVVAVGDDVFGSNGVGDPSNILPPRQPTHNHSHQPTLSHHLSLSSAYAAMGEPKFTNFTGHFVGTLDYIWYTRRTLRWISAVAVEDEAKMREHTALPSPIYPSDHIPLISEFEWNQE